MDLDRLIFGWRGLRISCWIVGIPDLSPSCLTFDAQGPPRTLANLLQCNKQSKFTATSPYRGKRGGGATEDRVNIRPDLDHLSYDSGLREFTQRP